MATKAELQRLSSLREKKTRESLGLFVVEGEKIVGELLAAGFPLEEVYATADWSGQSTHTLTQAEMTKISHLPTPACVLAVGRIKRAILLAGALDKGLTLALDGVQDPGNVGTLLRIADWYALDRVLLSPDCADLFSQKVINASMGSFARVAVYQSDLAQVLSKAHVPILGCDLRGDSVHQLGTILSAVIVIGSEGRGLSEAVRRVLTRSITIPRLGKAESLNAAAAGAIVCDNLRRS